MRRLWIAAALALALGGGPALAGPAEEARRLYAAFAESQNAHDLARVRALLLDGPDFLWVTNGLSVWGAEAALARMARFQANEVWRIEPDMARARAVTVTPGSAVLHVPLLLEVGRAAEPARYAILVSALCVETQSGWRIAALFTTDENRTEPAP